MLKQNDNLKNAVVLFYSTFSSQCPWPAWKLILSIFFASHFSQSRFFLSFDQSILSFLLRKASSDLDLCPFQAGAGGDLLPALHLQVRDAEHDGDQGRGDLRLLGHPHPHHVHGLPPLPRPLAQEEQARLPHAGERGGELKFA